jgi:phage shock protein PspC (stress-responsive transcriptional regulator)
VYVLPPASQLGPITPEQRQQLRANSLVAGVYEQTQDRDSAYESLKGRTTQRQPEQAPAKAGQSSNAPAEQAPAEGGMLDGVLGGLGNVFGGGTKRTRASASEQMVKSAASAIGREVGRQIIRGVLGGIFGGRR